MLRCNKYLIKNEKNAISIVAFLQGKNSYCLEKDIKLFGKGNWFCIGKC